MNNEDILNDLLRVDKQFNLSSEYSSDSESSFKVNDFESTEYCNGSTICDFSEVVDSISNLNVRSDLASSNGLISESSSNNQLDISTLDESDSISDTENNLASPEYTMSTFDSHYSTERTSSPDIFSTGRSNMDNSERNADILSNFSDNLESVVDSTTSRLSGPQTPHDSTFVYYEDNSPVQPNVQSVEQKSTTNPQTKPLNFDIFTPNNETDLNNKQPSSQNIKVAQHPNSKCNNRHDSSDFKNQHTFSDRPANSSNCSDSHLEHSSHHSHSDLFLQSQSNEYQESNASKSYSSNRPNSFDSDDHGYSVSNDETGTVDNDASDIEDQKSYVPGGYHPVSVGEVYNERYKIEAKLGWGYFSTVWLASDIHKADSFVALKFQRSAEVYSNAVLDEIELLKEINSGEGTNTWTSTRPLYSKLLGPNYNGTKGVVSFIDYFKVNGPNGTHICVVFEAMGPNILTLIRLYQFHGIPMDLVKKITTHVLLGLDYLHRVCKIIHTDLKPENILITSPLSNYNLKICTYGTDLSAHDSSNLNSEEPTHEEADLASVDNKINENTPVSNGPNEQAHDKSNMVNEVEYVKNTIRPCYSDPTLTTSYHDNYALQESFLKMPYHHITWNMMRAVDRNSNKSHYHPSILSSMGMNPYKLNRAAIKTSKGYVQIRPYTIEQFHHPNAIFKICDLGNACWINKHFTDEIQTRQYRSPEAILKIGYDSMSDIWSLACVIFELITGDYLFDPNGNNSEQRDSNHVSLIVELLGPIPNYMIRTSKKAKKMEFHNINKIKRWPLESVLVKKYNMDRKEAKDLSNFLSCMLRINPLERHTAQQLLSHKWLAS